MSRAIQVPLLASLALLVTAASLPGQSAPTATAKPTLGVVSFTNAAMIDREAWESQRQGVAENVTTMLRYHPGVTVLEREQIQPLLDEQNLGASGRVEPETVARIGKLLGAQYMLLGTITVDRNNRLRLAARAVEVETSRLVSGEFVDGSADDIMVLTDRLTERLLANLSLPPLPPRGNPDGPASGAAQDPPASVRASESATRVQKSAIADSAASTVAAVSKSQSAPASVNVARDQAEVEAERPVVASNTSSSAPMRRTAAALNSPRAGRDGLLALRLLSQGIKAEEEKKLEEAKSLYRRALDAVPEYVAARDRLARLSSQ